MKELISVKLSSAKRNQKVLKCTVYLDIPAVTCPGALLARPEEVYLSVCVMGQYRKTRCVPPVFPLLFKHKMVFVRSFPGAVDPADVSEQLETDTSTFELIQMVPPEGEILATLEEGTRDFVFPGPRLTSSLEAPERQILMRKSSSFPGIAPMVEFATTTVMEQTKDVGGQPATLPGGLHPVRLSPTPPSPTRTTSPPRRAKSKPRSPVTPRRPAGHRGSCGPSKRGEKEKVHTDKALSSPSSSLPGNPPPPAASVRRRGSRRTRGEQGPEASRYLRPTAASTSRALSPYTHRRMCELSEDARARLAHLQLGPHRFRKQTQCQPPFVVPFCSDVSASESPSYQRVSPAGERCPHRSGSARLDHPDGSLLGSYRPKSAKSRLGSTRTGLSPDLQATQRGAAERLTPVENARPTPGPSSSRSPLDPGHTSLPTRFHSSPPGPTQWEQIHSRVQRILQTHGTGQRHLVEQQEEELQRKGDELDEAHCGPQVLQDSTRVGEWTQGVYGRKPSERFPRTHRAAFEESLGNIYKSMYRKACDN